MDPNATLTAIHDALRIHDYTVAAENRRNLIIWLGKGGFSPDWTKYPDANAFVHAVRDSGVRRILRDAGVVNDHAFYRK